MTIFKHGSSNVFTSGLHGGLSEISNSAGKAVKQKINNLWPGCFVKDKGYEETSKKYSTIMLMLVKDDRGLGWGSNCVTLGMFLDDMLSCI